MLFEATDLALIKESMGLLFLSRTQVKYRKNQKETPINQASGKSCRIGMRPDQKWNEWELRWENAYHYGYLKRPKVYF
jgi:hypothetical protein